MCVRERESERVCVRERERERKRERERERERKREGERSPLDVNYYCQLSILEKSDIKTTEL